MHDQEWRFGCCYNRRSRHTTGQSLVQSPSSPGFSLRLRVVPLYLFLPGLSMHQLQHVSTEHIQFAVSPGCVQVGGVQGAPQGAERYWLAMWREYPAAGAFRNLVGLMYQKEDQKVT